MMAFTRLSVALPASVVGFHLGLNGDFYYTIVSAFQSARRWKEAIRPGMPLSSGLS